MSEATNDSAAAQFKNGADVHFDYNNASNTPLSLQVATASSSNRKKKKKKNKNKSKSTQNDPRDVQATINDPDVDYPTSRVIKQAPNGDVIVESLDDEQQESRSEPTSGFGATNIWDNSSIEEQENLKQFWESLDESQKFELVQIDKQSILELFKNEARSAKNNHANNNNNVSSAHGSQLNMNSKHCTCSYCGRQKSLIEDELESIYDNHFDDIIDFIHEVRDINDLNALPGLLFGGFHMLEEEHKLMKRQQRELNQLRNKHQYQLAKARAQEEELRKHLALLGEYPHSSCDHDHDHDHDHEYEFDDDHDHHHDHDHDHDHQYDHDNECPDDHDHEDHDSEHEYEDEHDHTLENNHESENQNLVDNFIEKIKELEDNDNSSNDHNVYQEPSSSDPKSQQELEELERSLITSLQDHLENGNPKDQATQLEILKKHKAYFDAKHMENSSLPDFESVKKQIQLLQKTGALKASIREQPSASKNELERLSFVRHFSKIFADEMNQHNKTPDKNLDENQNNFYGLSKFAEEFMKTDGNSFIDMMESLSESRTAREDLLREQVSNIKGGGNLSNHEKEALIEYAHLKVKSLLNEKQKNGAVVKPQFDKIDHIPELEFNGQTKGEIDHHLHDAEEDEEDEEVDDEDELDDEEQDDEEDEEEEEDDVEELSDTESEISEEEKMQEIRRLFLIQVIKLFQERLKEAYKEKLSKDRTQKLIEELEAEENAKQERENKKLKQREKAKEKKRLQQLAKEEERKRKEEEEKAKEEELKRKQEELRAEQKRKKEEARLKREEGKRKRIEELKRKEAENQKRIEAQRKKEEESKKLKEERRKKIEEERKKKEEEKKQKDLLKKQKEEERLRLQRMKEEEEEMAKALAEQEEEQRKLVAEAEAEAKALEFTAQTPMDNSLKVLIDELRLKSSPTKNHILDQLYQAKPRSMSSTSTGNSTPIMNQPQLSRPGSSFNMIEPLSTGGTNNLVSNLISPTSQPMLNNDLNNAPINGGFAPLQQHTNFGPQLHQAQPQLSPWGTSNTLLNNNIPHATSPPPTNANALNKGFNTGGFSPFGSNAPAVGSGFNDPFTNNPVNMTSNTGASSVWNTGNSRNNSIWSSTPSIPPNPLSLWNSNLGQDITNPGANATSQPTNNIITDSQLQTATWEAFKILEQTGQLEFSVAPCLKLFQLTKNVLSNTLISLHQFLSACRNTIGSGLQFDFVYDDMGTVTHIRVGIINDGGLKTSPVMPPPGFINPNIGDSLMRGFADLASTTNANANNPPPPTNPSLGSQNGSFSGGLRQLWN